VNRIRIARERVDGLSGVGALSTACIKLWATDFRATEAGT
jgi:hypothetical protein